MCGIPGVREAEESMATALHFERLKLKEKDMFRFRILDRSLLTRRGATSGN